MKNFLISTFLVLGISSCSKDSLDSVSPNLSSIDKSEIKVTVTYLSWSDLNCGYGCGENGTQTVSFISNAKVDLFSGDPSFGDEAGSGIGFGTTDKEGTLLFQEVDPGQYTILVDTPYGQKTRTFYTHLNKRSTIEFSF